MKHNKRITFLFLFILTNLFSQKVVDSTVSNLNNYRWRIEASVGDSRGIRPFKQGYFSSNNQKQFGTIYINAVDLGLTYTYSRIVDFKVAVGFDKFTSKDAKSLPYEAAQFRGTLQAVFDVNNLLKYQNDVSRFKLLFHAGVSLSILQNVDTNTDNRPSSKDLNGGIVLGITPMYRITKKAFIFLDFSSYNNYRQHRTWDGNYSDANNNLSGQMINGSIGLSLSIGKKVNWQTLEEKNLKKSDSILEKRVGDLETMMNDSDKDGVPDYLDNENNSIAGVAVDSRGIMVDMNKNNVPDELEKYFEEKYSNSRNGSPEQTIGTSRSETTNEKNLPDFISESINDGYVSVFFETNSIRPSSLSVDSINYILIYLKNNPSKSIDIIGHSDEIGSSALNEKLSNNRALAVKNILIKAGINAGRLNIASNGEDKSVDATSTYARSLVRRVTFNIK